MRLYRIYDHHAEFAKQPTFNPLDGAGGLYTRGRWNERGHLILYTSRSAALALAEILCHIPATLFGERTLLILEISHKLSLEEVTYPMVVQLIRNEALGDMSNTTRSYGTQWLSEGRSVLLRVPSIALPFEHNYLLNPRHPGFNAKVISRQIIILDPRIISLNQTA
jgi:RES domain-containing protein